MPEEKKRRKPGRKKKSEQTSANVQNVRPIVLSEALRREAKDKDLQIRETLYVHNRTEEMLPPADAAAAAGYNAGADSFKKIANRLEKKPHIAEVMKNVLQSKGMGADFIAEEAKWGIEQAKQARVVKDPVTGDIVEITPHLGAHAKYLQQIQNMNGLSTKGPTVAIQNNLGGNNGEPRQINPQPQSPINLEGLDAGTIVELIDAIRGQLGESRLPDIHEEGPAPGDSEAHPGVE